MIKRSDIEVIDCLLLNINYDLPTMLLDKRELNCIVGEYKRFGSGHFSSLVPGMRALPVGLCGCVSHRVAAYLVKERSSGKDPAIVLQCAEAAEVIVPETRGGGN